MSDGWNSENYASVNSSCAQPSPRANPWKLTFFFSWMANSRGWEHLSCQMPGGGHGNRGRMPRPQFWISYVCNRSLLTLNFGVKNEGQWTFLIFIVQKPTVVKTDILSLKRSSKLVSVIVMIRNTWKMNILLLNEEELSFSTKENNGLFLLDNSMQPTVSFFISYSFQKQQ